MADKTYWESIKVEGGTMLAGRLKELIHEGNVTAGSSSSTRVRRSPKFPLTAGVVGAVLAPVVAAVGAIVALLNDCTIQIEREQPTSKADTAA